LWFMSDGRHIEMLKKEKYILTGDMGQIFQFGTLAHLKWKKGSITPEVKRFTPFVERSHFPSQVSRKGRKGKKKRGRLETEYDMWWELQGAGSTASGNSTGRRISGGRSRLRPDVPSLHRIYLNGKMDDIPEAMLIDLDMVTDLCCEDYLTFRPETWRAYPKRKDLPDDDQGYGWVEGTVWVPGWETDWGCVVHNVPQHHADKVCENMPWQVMPYGVTTQVDKKFGCSIMARVRKYYYPEAEDTVDFKPEAPEEDSATDALVGPFGRYYSLEEWQRYTTNGCAHCSRDLEPDEHDEIWWVGEGEQTPLCSTCCDTLTKPIDSDDSELEELRVH